MFYYQTWMFYQSYIDIVPSASCCFSMFFTSEEINIRRGPNAMKLHDGFLWTKRKKLGPGCTWGSPEEGTTHQGAPGGPGTPWWVVPTSGAPRTVSLLYKCPKNPRNLGESTKYSSIRRRVQIQSRHHLGWGSLPPLVSL